MKQLIIIFLLIYQAAYSQITIDADFESGNLSTVQEIDSTSFYITTQADLGVDGGSTRWFYFRMSGVKDKNVNILITNSDVTKAMYSYDNESFIRFSDDEAPGTGLINKTFEQDTVWLSYYTPYNYSYLQTRIENWKQNQFVEIDTLGITPQGLPIQELIVTDNSVPNTDKKSVWIHARTHPSETPSSWHFDGIMNELLSNKEVVNFYLQEFEFHMIPFTNPDGVLYGRSRVNYEGINLEPNWDMAEENTSEEVKILRARMQELCDEKPFSVFLNLHSQAASYCTFWIHTAFSTSSLFYLNEYQFSNLNVSDNPYFLKEDYSESNLRSVYPEGWLWNNYGDQVMALTYETPYNNYFSNSSEPLVEVTNENLGEIGRRTVYAIAEYLQVNHPKHFILDNSEAIVEGEVQTYNITTDFYGDNFYVLDPSIESSVLFESESLPAGNYDISAWWPTSDGNSFQTVFEMYAGSNYYEDTKTQKINGGQWNYLTTVELNTEGSISIKLKNNSSGLVIADAFRLIYSGPITSVEKNELPTDFILYQNYPNPFNPSTTIRYSIPNSLSNQKVTLIIYDILGRQISNLVNEQQYAGQYEVNFDGSKLTSGTYICRLQVGKNVDTKKMILVK